MLFQVISEKTITLKNKPILYIFPILLFLGSCSTQKNTFMSRTYHSITSKYNILFNGSESFKKGHYAIVQSYKDDFTEILPVFYYGDNTQVQAVASDMDRTIKKGEKLVSLHSISVKPEIKNNKPLSPAQREFHNKKEYNNYVDENYLLMGKAYFYKHDFDKAKETFLFMLNEFKNNKTLFETRIWLARTYNETGNFKNAGETLKALGADVALPNRLRDDLWTTYADFFIKQKQYEEAIPYLEKARKVIHKKRLKVRYTFILAQLYEKTNKLKKASETYGRVIKMNPPYEMTFYARINRALAYEKGYGSVKEIESQLNKMLRDDKNIEYQDQIYYALGNLANKEGNKKLAVERYRKSIDKSTTNAEQKTRSYLTLANLYYEEPDYMNAQAYYDSAVSMLDISYPGYDILYAKSKNLTSLVKQINTVAFEDSVQRLSKLSHNDLIAFIDKLIEDVRKKEEEDRLREQERMLNEQFGQQMSSQNITAEPGSTGGGQWYFYNVTAKALGYKEFKLKWGNRKLEDNWRRKNRSTSGFSTVSNTEDIESPAEEAIARPENQNNKSRDYYLRNIPLNDSTMQASDKKIENAMYTMGIIYKNDLKDNERAIQSFKELISRFPSSEYLLRTYYEMYSIYKLDANLAMAEFYKNKIIGDFPESSYAKLLSNPNYLKELEKAENKVNIYYAETYEKYKKNLYQDVITRCDYALANYPDDNLVARFAYLRALSLGQTAGVKVLRENLFTIISKYPGTEVSDNAQHILAFIDKERPALKEEQEKVIAGKLYEFNAGVTHFFGFVVPKNINNNQLIFNIINFNLDNYDKLNLRVETVDLNPNQSVVILKSFRDMNSAMDYYRNITGNQEVFRDVDASGIYGFVISEPNFAVLNSDKSPERYMKFFTENYPGK